MASSKGAADDVWQTAPRRLRHWRRVRLLTVSLLIVWGVVTVLACWFAQDLNRFRLAGFPFGFWMSAQGAIAVYVLLIALYAGVMDRWEQALSREEAARDPVRD